MTETWVPLQRWSKTLGSVAVNRVTAAVPTYALRTSNGVFILRLGSQVADWDGLELRLGFAPQMIDGQLYVHTLDLAKTVQPAVGNSPGLCRGTNPVIVIDPGHGGENAGTKSVLGSHYEKEYTLDWALRLQALLATNGWDVWLTRSNDTDLAISNRVAFAEGHKADLFLSLHFNSAAPNQTEAGLETYCLTPAGMPSSLTRGYADDAAQSFPNNTFDAENLRLALRVHRALLQVNGNHDRGVRRARFPGVLRGQNRPAILIEGGYLSNPHEARLIADPAYRQKLAEAVAKALLTGDKGQEMEGENPKSEGQQTGPRKQEAEGGGQRSQAESQPSRITHHASRSTHSA
jgi:N-acetylmuramoyl-L-alanine amidase